MPRHPLSSTAIEQILRIYEETHNISEVRRKTGHSWRIIAKYIGEGRKRQVVPIEAVRAYRMTGSLLDAAKLVGVHPSTIWRGITKAGVTPQGAKDSKRLYRALRKRVNESQWRQDVLDRDGHCCVRCGAPSAIAHHEGFKLADMRDQVFRKHPQIDPFASRRELTTFLDLVMALHEVRDGLTLCKPCHDAEHSNSD